MFDTSFATVLEVALPL